MMRLVVRLSIVTLGWINKLEEVYNVEFGGLQLSQGHIISKAYYILNQSSNDIKMIQWKNINEAQKPKGTSNVSALDNNFHKKNITSLILSDKTFEGIKKMQEFLPKEFDTTRVNTGFCIKLIVKAALLELEAEKACTTE